MHGVDQKQLTGGPAEDQASGRRREPYGVDGRFALIDFDFTLINERNDAPAREVERVRAHA